MKELLKTAAVVTSVAAWGIVSAVRNVLAPAAQTGAPVERKATFFGVSIRKWLLMAGAMVSAAATAGLLVVVSGIAPIKASSGHWAITAWFLNFSMARSVGTHAAGIQPPPLDETALVVKGAGHYGTGCAPCHGHPELRHPPVAAAMTPHPPFLPPTIPDWTAAELFYIVKHGVKFTGMPAWPALQRDDEVWAVVAFLRRLPDLDAAAYHQLVNGPVARDPGVALAAAIPDGVVENCARCHGLDGHGRGSGAFPRLAGQRVAYLEAALVAYARRERHSGIMEPVAAGLRLEDIRELATYYAGQPSRSGGSQEVSSQGRGEAIAQQGVPEQRVPACASCHGADGAPRNPHYPVLHGQHATYLMLQLELFKKKVRGGSPYAHLMHEVAPRLTMEQIRDVAQYYSSL